MSIPLLCRAPARREPRRCGWLPRGLITAISCLPFGGIGPQAAAQEGAPAGSFEDLAQSWLAEQGVVPGREDSADLFEQVLVERFGDLSLGLLDLSVPLAGLARADGCRRLQEIATALVDLQDRWLHLVRGEKVRRGRSVAPEAAVIKKWIRTWRPLGPDQWQDLGEEGHEVAPRRALADLWEADSKVREALRGFVVRVRSGEDLGWQQDAVPGASVILAPDRETFVGLCAVVGLAQEAARPSAWVPATFQRTVFRWQDRDILALEYADPAGIGKDHRLGLSMNERDKTGELQHVVHHGALHLVASFFGTRLEPAVESGLATFLTVEILGEDNARVGGSESGSSVAGRSKFVVGGRSEGGKFPKLSAESSWRADKGEDYFLGALRTGQKRGQKEMPADADPATRNGWLLLESATGGPGRPVCAPFLGEMPGSGDLPAEYRDDAQELFRAFGCAFVHWWTGQKAKGDKGGEESFGRLLREAAQGDADFEEVVRMVYGAPLTSAGPKGGGLEWEFLRDLARR